MPGGTLENASTPGREVEDEEVAGATNDEDMEPTIAADRMLSSSCCLDGDEDNVFDFSWCLSDCLASPGAAAAAGGGDLPRSSLPFAAMSSIPPDTAPALDVAALFVPIEHRIASLPIFSRHICSNISAARSTPTSAAGALRTRCARSGRARVAPARPRADACALALVLIANCKAEGSCGCCG